MMIYEMVCDKVCHSIYHGAFNSVEGQAQMLPSKTDKFFFIMHGKRVEVEFNVCSYIIRIECGDTKWTNFINSDTIYDIAYDIVDTTELLML